MAQVLEKDSLALVEFYNSLDGPNWVYNGNWLSGPVGSWAQVQVKNGRVVDIRMAYNGLSGQIPESINNLDALEHLELGYNTGLKGPLPPLDSLKNLNFINISEMAINGPFPLFLLEMSNLVNLDLYDCQFSGTLPDLFSLQKLEVLQIGQNDFGALFLNGSLI